VEGVDGRLGSWPQRLVIWFLLCGRAPAASWPASGSCLGVRHGATCRLPRIERGSVEAEEAVEHGWESEMQQEQVGKRGY